METEEEMLQKALAMSLASHEADAAQDTAITALRDWRDAAARDKAALTIHAYIGNIEKDPSNEKYRRIRKENAAFKDRVAGLPPALDLMKAWGWRDSDDGQFLTLPESADDVARGKSTAAALSKAIPSAVPASMDPQRKWAPPGVVTEIDSPLVYREVIKGPKLVCVDFHARWCGPCKMIAPLVENFARFYTEVVFIKVDVDVLQEVSMDAGVRAMPTFQFYRGGQRLREMKGANPQGLEQLLNELA